MFPSFLQVEGGEEDDASQYERKEKNRLAAQKCRNKKRERADTLENVSTVTRLYCLEYPSTSLALGVIILFF